MPKRKRATRDKSEEGGTKRSAFMSFPADTPGVKFEDTEWADVYYNNDNHNYVNQDNVRVSDPESSSSENSDSDDEEPKGMLVSVNIVPFDFSGKNRTYMIPTSLQEPICIDFNTTMLDNTSSFKDFEMCLLNHVKTQEAHRKFVMWSRKRVKFSVRQNPGGKTRSTMTATVKNFDSEIEANKDDINDNDEFTIVIVIALALDTSAAATTTGTGTDPNPTTLAAPKPQVKHVVEFQIQTHCVGLNKTERVQTPASSSDDYEPLFVDVTSAMEKPGTLSHKKGNLPNPFKPNGLTDAAFFSDNGLRQNIVNKAKDKNPKVQNNSRLYFIKNKNGINGIEINNVADLIEKISSIPQTRCQFTIVNKVVTKIVMVIRLGFSQGSNAMISVLKQNEATLPPQPLIQVTGSAANLTVLASATAKSAFTPTLEKLMALFFEPDFCLYRGFTEKQARIMVKWKICGIYANYKNFMKEPCGKSIESVQMFEDFNWDNPVMSPNGTITEPAPFKNAYPDATEVPTGTIVAEETPSIQTGDQAIAAAMGAAATTNATSAKEVAKIEASTTTNATLINAMDTGVVTTLIQNRKKISIAFLSYMKYLKRFVFDKQNMVKHPLPINLRPEFVGSMYNGEEDADEQFQHISDHLPAITKVLSNLKNEIQTVTSEYWIDNSIFHVF